MMMMLNLMQMMMMMMMMMLNDDDDAAGDDDDGGFAEGGLPASICRSVECVAQGGRMRWRFLFRRVS